MGRKMTKSSSSSSLSSMVSSSRLSSPSSRWSSSFFSGIVLIILLCVISSGLAEETNDGGYPENTPESEIVCTGTSKGFSQNTNHEAYMMQMRKRYTNCTYVVGNLELVFMDEVLYHYDLSFLSTIKEITGHVLIVANKVEYIPLHNLRIIRGHRPYYHPNITQGYSLFISINNSPDNKTGLKELRFTKLTEILNGGVFFQNNNFLCFDNTIHWRDINPNLSPPVRYINGKGQKRQCGECHPKCHSNVTNKRHCWGEGPDMCQELTHVVCHLNCGDGRCYGSAPNQCCHPECAGGCTGPRKTDCFACRNMRDEGGCVAQCPPLTQYDKEKMMRVPNANPKYAYGSMCVAKCPDFMLIDEDLCVNSCPDNKKATDGKHCEKCEGGICPRNCTAPTVLTAENIHTLAHCTIVHGTLNMIGLSVSGDKHRGIEPLHPSNLTILNSVKEITGSLMIQSFHEEFKDLSFLSNLEVIHGRIAAPKSKDALNIMGTELQSLELKSLKSIRNGDVFIVDNQKLCYISDIDWTQVVSHQKQNIQIQFNRNPQQCIEEGKTCHDQCGTSGCWGPGPDKCFKCRNYEYEAESLCLNRCSDKALLYHGEANGKCAKCHSECANSCTGPSDTHCDACVNVMMRNKDGVVQCLPECGDSMYPNVNKDCMRCHPFCGIHGCTGDSKTKGKGGCDECEIGLREDANTTSCMSPDTVSCQAGYYMSSFTSARLCEKCHPMCLTCTGSSSQFCDECKHFKFGEHCVAKCPNMNFGNPDTKRCEECHHECRGGCTGNTTFNCTACSNFKIYPDPESSRFNCTSECPPDLPFTVRDEKDDENRIVCADGSHPEVQAMKDKDASEEKRKLIIILCSTIFGAILLLALVACIGFFCSRRAQDNKKTAEFTAKITGTGREEMEPLTPSSAKPDLAKMRLINESELRRGNIIGSGAFGTVYKGIWIPAGENVKIPVAIKVLQEETSPGQSSELLNEARVMCSVEHICCVRILAVCMSSQMMLITQLMPHGCLLEYVRANKTHIGSKVLLDWCAQIAKGMAYLEERSVVHRDLAARNVLVQTPNQVKITDFGLAKLLDNEAEEYHASGGLMPIKWLALECIQHRIFTHKTDVWSYGVTVWELFTYGKKPYEGIRTRDVPMMLEKGERLQQPMICTIDVYMIMVKCWMLESDSRPSFKELAEEFSKMSRDPGRYLVIEGDSLMRLHDVNFRKEELVRGMSEVPGDIMDAEEYLQPSDPLDYTNQSMGRSTTSLPYPPVFDRQSSRSPSSPTPLIPISEQSYNFDSFPRRGKGSHDELRDGPKIRDRKYGHLQSAARAKQERQPRSREDSVSSRYTSDPIKFSKDKGEIEWSAGQSGGYPPSLNDTPRSHHYNRGPHHGVGRPYGKAHPVQLPLDEDNYLQPQAACAYMDLSSKGYYQNEKAFGSTQAEPVLAELERSESRTSDRSRHGSVRSRLDSSNSKTGSTSSAHNDNNHHYQHHPQQLHRQLSSPASPTSPSHSMGSLKDHPSVPLPHSPHALSATNPEYFDGLEMDYEEDDVWEPKKSAGWNGYHNGYQPVPNGPTSPLHTANGGVVEEGRPVINSSKENGYSYYNNLEGVTQGDSQDSVVVPSKQNGSMTFNNNNGSTNTLPMVNTRATIQSGRHASESLV